MKNELDAYLMQELKGKPYKINKSPVVDHVLQTKCIPLIQIRIRENTQHEKLHSHENASRTKKTLNSSLADKK